MPKVKILQDDKKPIATEIIAANIQAIAQGMRNLRRGSLNERALVVLLYEAIPKGGKVAHREIRAVLNAMDDLERLYVKKKAN